MNLDPTLPRGASSPRFSPRGSLAALALAMLLSSFGTSSANVGLPTIARALAASFQTVQWIVLAYLVSLTALVVGAGRLGDIFGRRRLLSAGLAMFAVASVLCGIAPNVGVLIAARALQGAAAAVMMALTFALVGDALPREQTGRSMGLLATMSAVGTALGPSLGGILLATGGWRALFLANVPLALAAVVLARRYLPEIPSDPTRTSPPFDVAGTVLLAMALSAYALGTTLGRGEMGPVNLGLLGLAAVVGWLFVRVQLKRPFPLVRLGLFREREFRVNLGLSALVGTVMMTTMVVGPYYLANGLGLDAARTGLALAVGPVVAALTGAPAGKLVDRLGAWRVGSVGLAGIAAGALLLATLPLSDGAVGYLVPIAILTAGYGLFQTANSAAVMFGVAAEERGVTSGLLNLARNLGLVTGAAVMAAVFAYGIRSAGPTAAEPAAVGHAMQITFALAGGLVLLALALTLRSGRLSPPGIAAVPQPSR